MDGVQVVRYRYAPEILETLVNDGGIVSNLRRAKWKYLLVPTFFLGQGWGICALLKRHQIDVIHAHWLVPQGLVAAILRKLPGRTIPLVVTSHGADLYALRGRAMETLKRWVARMADSVSVVSRPMREEMTRIGVDARKVLVLPMGVDLDCRFTPNNTRRSASDILFVGRLVEKKGLRYLIEAMPAILLQRPDARLIVAGFGPEEEMLRGQVKKLGITAAVDFIGPVTQEELPALYRNAAVFVAPFIESIDGDMEGLGLVTIEAVGCGCPVVVGDVPAVRDVLNAPEEAGLRVQARDTEALANAVLKVLSTPVQSSNTVVGLRNRMAVLFGWDNVAAGYSSLLMNAFHNATCKAKGSG
jgi:glycosyltransferase involved in cell wall biosynthesis